MSQLIPSTTANRQFKDHIGAIRAVAVFPDKRRMITGSFDKTLRLWDLKTGSMLKKMEGHRNSRVKALAVSRDGQLIASGDENGGIIAWHGETGEYFIQVMMADSGSISSLDFSPDGTVLAGSNNTHMIKLWSTTTWQLEGNPIEYNGCRWVFCVRYSPSGELLAVATDCNIKIYNTATRECITSCGSGDYRRLAWTPDGTRLLSAGSPSDPTIREWDPLTWKQVGDPWTDCVQYNCINAIAIHPTGTLLASASDDNTVRLWQLSDRRTIAIFQHSGWAGCVTFSMDGKHIFSGGFDKMISEWAIPEDALPKVALCKPASKAQIIHSKIISINTTARNACITGDLSNSPSASIHPNMHHASPPPLQHSLSQPNMHCQPPPLPQPSLNQPDVHAHLMNPQMGYPRPINRVAPPQFLTHFHAMEENWHMTEELMAEIERADYAQALSQQPPVPGMSGVTYAGGAVSYPRPINRVAPPQSLTHFHAMEENWHMTEELMAEIERADYAQALSQQPPVPGAASGAMYVREVPSPLKDSVGTHFREMEENWHMTRELTAEIEQAELAEALNKPASKILSINTTARNACITGNLSTAEKVFTQEIDTDANNYSSYAHRSLVMARKYDWDRALEDAIRSITIQPSLIGYISKGIALCGKGHVRDARTAFNLAFIFTDEDTKTIYFLLLVKSIAMFNADQHEEAMMLVQQLAAVCPNNDTLACRAVEAYLYVRLGIEALKGARHNEAADHFTAAINSSAFSAKSDSHSIYEDLAVLFGWDLEPLWQIAHQARCHALLRAGRLGEALESYRYLMDMSNETTKVSCLDWSTAFKQECSVLGFSNGNVALAASDYDRAIDLYSVVISLNVASDTVFAHRSIAKSGKMLWEDALLDAQKVIELNPSSHVGYEVKHAALHGAQRYDEAIDAVEMMISRLDSATDMQIKKLREQYVSPSDAEGVIRQVIDVQLDTAPLRLLNTATGLLCDREAQISIFKTSIEYKALLSSIMKHANLRMERITEVVAMYFRCVMLSHRWERKEPLLQDIQDKVVYKMNLLGGIVNLRTFCEIARDAGYRWAWSDTCCIDKSNNVELQESLNSMFVWYRHSALTIVYLPDVLPSSKSGALAKSEWNRRGWTFQEFLASKVLLFYQNDWSLYLDDHSPNHKESVTIMEELEDATGIDAQALISFRPGMRGAREKLQWASKRITTLQEDIAYSLFGIFGVHLPVIYGEKKQNALGRLLQEIVARSGDISALDWVGQSSEFNSCLPADITSYAAPPCAPPSLSENDFQTAVSSLRDSVAAGLALKLYTRLENMNAPRFANCRLHLPCIAFRVAEIRRKRGIAQETLLTYGIKADGLHNLLITTKDTLTQFTSAKPTPQTFLLVRAWDRRLLELPDFAELPAFTDDLTSLGDWSESESLLDQLPGISPAVQDMADSESHSRALQLIVRLGQSFSAFLLAQQRGGEYKRVATDHDIIAQVRDMTSVHSMMDIRTLEIL